LTVPIARVTWKPCRRIIPSRFPPVQLFERVADPEDLEAIFELDALTNPRLRDAVGDLELVPPEDRVSGPGTTVIMATFAYLNPLGSRFSDGTYGVFLAANNLDTAIAETRHHRERFLNATAQGQMELDMRVYLVDLDGKLHDLRGQMASQHLVYRNDNYAAGQQLARTLREAGSNGIAYEGIRRRGGECVALFRWLQYFSIAGAVRPCVHTRSKGVSHPCPGADCAWRFVGAGSTAIGCDRRWTGSYAPAAWS